MGLVTLNEVKAYLGIGGIIYPAITVPLTINTAAATITRTTGSWAVDKIVPGSLITLAGFTDAGNNVQVAVTEVTSPLVIKYLGPSGMVNGTGPTTSFNQADPVSDTTYDSFITEQIEVISDAIEKYCGRKFISTNYTQTIYRDQFTNQDDTKIFLATYPLSTITTIKLDTVDVTGYRIEYDMARLTKIDGFISTGEELVITYVAGYSACPSPVRQALYSIIEEKYNKKKSGVAINFGNDVQSISIPGTVSITYDYSLQGNERKSMFGMILGNYINLIDPYRSERTIVGKIEETRYA